MLYIIFGMLHIMTTMIGKNWLDYTLPYFTLLTLLALWDWACFDVWLHTHLLRLLANRKNRSRRKKLEDDRERKKEKASVRINKPFSVFFPDPKELISCATRLQPLTSKLNNAPSVLADLLRQSQFQRLLNIHNTIQSVQCFQCPPVALCSDSRNLVEQVRKKERKKPTYSLLQPKAN